MLYSFVLVRVDTLPSFPDKVTAVHVICVHPRRGLPQDVNFVFIFGAAKGVFHCWESSVCDRVAIQCHQVDVCPTVLLCKFLLLTHWDG